MILVQKDHARFGHDGVIYPRDQFNQIKVAHDVMNGDHLFSRDNPMVWPKPWPGVKLTPIYSKNCASENVDTALEHAWELA